jgi:hypothetical protein
MTGMITLQVTRLLEFNRHHDPHTGKFTSGGVISTQAPAGRESATVGKVTGLLKAGGHTNFTVKSLQHGGVKVTGTSAQHASKMREYLDTHHGAKTTHPTDNEIHVAHLNAGGSKPSAEFERKRATVFKRETPAVEGRRTAKVSDVRDILSKSSYEGYTVKSLPHGGVAVTHPDTRTLTGINAHLAAHGADIRIGPHMDATHVTHITPGAKGKITHVADPSKPKPATAPKLDTKASAKVREKMLAWDAEREATLQRLNKDFQDTLSRYNAEVTKAIDLPTAAARKARFDELDRHPDFSSEHLDNLREARDRAHNTRLQDLRERFIYQKPDDRIKLARGIQPEGQYKPTADHIKRWQAGLEEYKRIVGDSMGGWIDQNARVNADLKSRLSTKDWEGIGMPEAGTIHFFPTNDNRSFNRMGSVHMASAADVSTAVHELGHSLEYHVPEVALSRQEFYKKRTEGQPLRKMKDVYPGHGYDDHEETRADHFVHAYMGKEYGSPNHSEMVSMGLQMLHDDPVGLAKRDPEYFDWIHALVRHRAK